MAILAWILALMVNILFTTATPFEPVHSWRVVSSAVITGNATKLSLPGIDTSKWYRLNATKGTLMATLIANGVYTENDLF
jgi:hypothetical protein